MDPSGHAGKCPGSIGETAGEAGEARFYSTAIGRFVSEEKRREQMNVNYDDIGDILEYGNISDNKAIELCNDILKESINEKDNVILESMFHAIYMGVLKHNIAQNIDIDIILPKLEFFNEELLDYIITIMAFSGDLKYIELIEKIGEIYPELDVDEAILELKSNR